MHFAGSITDSGGKLRVAFHVIGSVTRSDFGLVAELKEEAGSMLIGDDITLDIEAEASLSQ